MATDVIVVEIDALATSNASDVYTAPANRVSTLRKVEFFNYDSSDRTVQVWIAGDGGAAANGNLRLKEVIAADAPFYPNFPGRAIPQGGKIYITADSGAAVNASLTITEETQKKSALYS